MTTADATYAKAATLQVRDHQLNVVQRQSPHADLRPDSEDINLIVIHGISLPAGEFATAAGTPYVEQLFMGTLDTQTDERFAELDGVRVSAHVVIYRTGEVVQFVPFVKRAWHAGRSHYCGRRRCNDYSIGIELEGTDTTPYTAAQYQQLAQVCVALIRAYPQLSLQRIVGHCHIAPVRKTDPGPAFDWARFRHTLLRVDQGV